MKDRLSYVFLPLGLLFMSLLASGCTLGSYEDYQLGVPYRQQERSDYCVPASVLMWRLYDGLSSISQTSIYNWLGGSACRPDDAARAVNHFTFTFDAYLDVVFVPDQIDREELIARQATSEDRGVPVMAIVGRSRDHVGIINGGKYTRQGSYYQWEFLYFHDPAPMGQNLYYSAQNWLNTFCPPSANYCGQIISSAATSGWQNYSATYGNSVLIYGETCPPSQCGPIEY